MDMEYPLGFHLVVPQAINEEHECIFHESLASVNQDGRLHKINCLALHSQKKNCLALVFKSASSDGLVVVMAVDGCGWVGLVVVMWGSTAALRIFFKMFLRLSPSI